MQVFEQINFICHQNSVFNRVQTEGQTVTNTQIDLDLPPICFRFASVLLPNKYFINTRRQANYAK